MSKALLTFFLAGILASTSPAEEKGISVGELNRMRVTGELGVPLHTLHIIECGVVDMSFTRAKADDGRLALKIVSVDGTAREGDHYIDLPENLVDEEPTVGTAFRFWGYETVIASGYPTEAFEKLGELPFATVGLHFRSKLVILKLLNTKHGEGR